MRHMAVELSDIEKKTLQVIKELYDVKGEGNVKLEDVGDKLRAQGVDVGQIMDILYGLEDKGLIRLEVVGYTTIIYLTDKGKEVVKGL